MRVDQARACEWITRLMIGVEPPRMARREEGSYSPYVTEEQRRQRGWIGVENDRSIRGP
jgi:hypothetical protein